MDNTNMLKVQRRQKEELVFKLCFFSACQRDNEEKEKGGKNPKW